MSNRSEIQKLLTQFTPLEEDFKKIYEQSGAPVREDDFMKLLGKYGGLPHNLKAEFQTVTNAGSLDIPADLPPDHRFSDAQWVLEDEDISIRKHPRYSPAAYHTHSFIEIAYVLKGVCHQDFLYPDGQSERLELKEGSLCILPPKLEHRVMIFDDSIMINLLIRTSVMKNTLAELVAGGHALFDFFLYTLYENTRPNFLLFHTKGDDSIRDLVLDMVNESCMEKQYNQKALLLMLGLFFTYLQREHSEGVQFSQTTKTGIQYIPQILNYIQQHYADTSVEGIARRFSFSTSYLGRIFRENTQTTVMEVIQQVRIQKACELLVSTRLSVQNVSEMVGYSDVTYFIRMFKKHQQMTPLQYRKMKREAT